jgi:uncharacterized membrane protein YeaQ/YmgE (transglycosylase-associated protein family)
MIKIVVLIIIASICGSIGAKIAGKKTGGCLTSIALGFIGAILGSWISRQLEIKDFLYYRDIPLIWSIIGAAVFVAIINLISGNSSSSEKS